MRRKALSPVTWFVIASAVYLVIIAVAGWMLDIGSLFREVSVVVGLPGALIAGAVFIWAVVRSINWHDEPHDDSEH